MRYLTNVKCQVEHDIRDQKGLVYKNDIDSMQSMQSDFPLKIANYKQQVTSKCFKQFDRWV